MSNRKQRTAKSTENQTELPQGDLTGPQAIVDLKNEIIDEAKKIANQKTSSAAVLVSKTQELLRMESLIS